MRMHAIIDCISGLRRCTIRSMVKTCCHGSGRWRRPYRKRNRKRILRLLRKRESHLVISKTIKKIIMARSGVKWVRGFSKTN